MYYFHAGLAVGLIIRSVDTLTEVEKNYLGFPGEILMQMLQFITVPLIVTSVIIGKIIIRIISHQIN